MFHVKHEGWAPVLLETLKPPQIDLLDAFSDLLLSRAIPRGYISPGDQDKIWERHVLDGLRGLEAVRESNGRIADLGSGAGVPAIPLAIALPEREFLLVEPRKGRVAFLESAVDDLRLSNVRVFHGKAEGAPDGFGVCLARALAPAADSWALAAPLLEPDGTLVYWAGSSFEEADLAGLGGSVRVSIRSDLADLGPLVIMGRQ
jgi:16S rRNA (guanine527-N7)-methyltransferase